MSFPLNLIRDDLQDFRAYSSARHLAQEGSIFLDANENPYDPSEGEQWNRYPEPQPQKLIDLLANTYGCREEQVLVSRGSDEAIDLLIRGFCETKRNEIIICPPTYGVYEFYAKLQGAGVKAVPLKQEDFSPNIDEIKKAADKNTKLIFLCNPNNPTGNTLPLSEIRDLLQAVSSQSLVVVDEAYIEFSEVESSVRLLDEHSNLVILRTLSKAWGLAGLRCGSLLGHPELVTFLKKIIAPYPLARPVYKAAIHALLKGRPESLVSLTTERKNLVKELSQLSCVEKIYPSQANFVLVRFNEALKLFDYLKGQGIVVRSRASDEPTKNCLRLSIGKPQENEQLLNAIRTWENLRA